MELVKEKGAGCGVGDIVKQEWNVCDCPRINKMLLFNYIASVIKSVFIYYTIIVSVEG